MPVRTDHNSSLPHCFWTLPTLPESAEFIPDAIQGIVWLIEKMKRGRSRCQVEWTMNSQPQV